MSSVWILAAVAVASVVAAPYPTLAQGRDSSHVMRSPPTRTDTSARVTSLDSLIGSALAVSPAIRAARAHADAVRHRVGAAAAWPDPLLMFGVVNQPLGRGPTTLSAHGTPTVSGPDPMTMRMVGISQTIPYPGKTALQRSVAQRGADEAAATLDMTRQQVARDVKAVYYELAFLDRALVIVGENQSLLASLVRTTEARYSVGQATQQDVLNARVEATRLGETASAYLEQRRAALARLNAMLDRPSDSPIAGATISEAVRHAVIGDSSQEIRFAATTLGARAAGSPLPPVTELQDRAIQFSPELREHEAMIAAQGARLELARKSYLPDVDVSVQYGQRGGNLPDMLTATVGIPLPIQKRRKQDELTAEASTTLEALHIEHVAKVNGIRADVARLASELERERTQLALYHKAILPQARASLASSTAGYQVGRSDFRALGEAQAALFSYETDYWRALSDFATNLAELERVVGKEVIP